MITKDIEVNGAAYKLTLTDQVLNQVDNLKGLYATAAEDPESFEQVSSEISAAINNIAESVSPEVEDGDLDQTTGILNQAGAVDVKTEG